MSESHQAQSDPPETKPVLASDALRDDLAPVEPWRVAARAWLGLAGAMFILLDFLPGQGRPEGLGSSVAIGCLAIVAAAAPLSYAARATTLVTIGLAVGLGGIAGVGPARVVHVAVGYLATVHLLAATSLPAALLFRSRYRAYEGTRYFLVTGLGLALPFVGYNLALFGRTTLGVQIVGGLAVMAIGLGLLGFMGAGTHISGHYIAGAIILAIATQLGLQAFVGFPTDDWLAICGRIGSLLAFAAGNVLGSLGAFQLLARRHWSEARSVDLRREHPGDQEKQSLGDSWLSHD